MKILQKPTSLGVCKISFAISALVSLSSADTFNFIPIFEDPAYFENHTGINAAPSALLNDSDVWDSDGFIVDTTVDDERQGNCLIREGTNAIYLEGKPIKEGDSFFASIDISFTAATDARAGTRRPIANIGFFSATQGGNQLRLGFNRVRRVEYSLTLQTTPADTPAPPITGGDSSVRNFGPGAIGINRDNDLESDLLRLSMKLTRGQTNDDWSVEAQLHNIEEFPRELIAEFSATGVTFNTSNTLFAGFGRGGSDSNSRVSDREIETFIFERNPGVGTPPAILDPPPNTPNELADLNQNGLPDFGELFHPNVAQFPPLEDSDSDGISNLEELISGTDPFDSNSLSGRANLAFASGTVENPTFSFQSVNEVRYEIQVSDTLDADNWSTLTIVTSDGGLTEVNIDSADLPSPDRSFFRARVLPSPDTDLDGLEDSLERYLGFDPNEANSVRSASDGGDYEQFFRLLTGASPQGGIFNTTTPGIPSPEQASRFLAQASFGATDTSIDYLRSLGSNAYEKWIDEQILIPANFTRPYLNQVNVRVESDIASSSSFTKRDIPHFATDASGFATFRHNLNTVWMRHALFGEDQLRQRVAWALSQIVVTGPLLNRRALPLGEWYDTVIRNSLGNYEDLLYDIALNPWMGQYLSSINNEKADPSNNQLPDENFAREVMQLFSIGLVELEMDGSIKLDTNGDPIPTYSNEDIVQLARVFTGLRINNSNLFRNNIPHRFANGSMLMDENRHDTGGADVISAYGGIGEKRFLGMELPVFSDDPGRSGLDDIRDAIAILIDHPSCPPFICTNLIQHLVTSNPSRAYVQRVSSVFANDGNGVRGNLAATVKAILLDPEARTVSSQFLDNQGRLKGPMLRTTSLAKAFRAGSESPLLHDVGGIQFWSGDFFEVAQDFIEYPFEYPSVFNFYSPEYARPGEIVNQDLVSPEFQILNSVSSIRVPNRFLQFVEEGFHTERSDITPEFRVRTTELEAIAGDTNALIDRLNLLLCHGTMDVAERQVIANALEANPNLSPPRKARLAIFLTVTSSSSAILR